MTPERSPSEPDVVDLVAIAEACAPAVAYYDEIRACAESGDRPDPHTKARLHEALCLLRSLPRCGGRLERAIAVVASGGVGSPVGDTLHALEMLRATLGLRPHVPCTPPTQGLTLVGKAPVQLRLLDLEADSPMDGKQQVPPPTR